MVSDTEVEAAFNAQSTGVTYTRDAIKRLLEAADFVRGMVAPMPKAGEKGTYQNEFGDWQFDDAFSKSSVPGIPSQRELLTDVHALGRKLYNCERNCAELREKLADACAERDLLKESRAHATKMINEHDAEFAEYHTAHEQTKAERDGVLAALGAMQAIVARWRDNASRDCGGLSFQGEKATYSECAEQLEAALGKAALQAVQALCKKDRT